MGKYMPRERKHRRLAKQGQVSNGATSGDPNAAEVLPESKSDRETRRSELKDELRAARPQSATSSKKRKRLDKYIDTKLRRDEERDLLKKLEGQHVDTSLFLSSKRLGRGTDETKRESLQRALKEKEAGVDVRGDHDVVLFQKRKDVDLEPPSDEESDKVDEGKPKEERNGNSLSTEAQIIQPVSTGGLFGSGLRRPLDIGADGKPAIRRRKRQKRNKTTQLPYEPHSTDNQSTSEEEEETDIGWDIVSSDVGESGSEEEQEEQEENEWNGFSAEEGQSDSGTTDEGAYESEGDSEGSESSELSEDRSTKRSARSSAFKDWAYSQRNESLGFKPSALNVEDAEFRANFKPRERSPDPVAQEIVKEGTSLSRPAEAVTIPRGEEIQKARLELPVVQEEQRIMEAVYNNPVIILCGATGSGKTTQVPQMLLEGGYGSKIGDTSNEASLQSHGLIGVTQPRRVAAISVADRVSIEMGKEFASKVAYQVRYDTTTNRGTSIKFMTDGILLREISQDFILSKYSVIVLDEAHERSVNTDILIGMLSRIVDLREELAKEEPDKYYPLKLVVMSATLRVSDFVQNARLFRSDAPPIVQAEGRQYSVVEHFSRKTQRDYVTEMCSKVARGHRKLPPGSMLVFMTGQQEIQALLKALRSQIGNTAGIASAQKARESADQMPLEMDDIDAATEDRDTLEGEDSDSGEAEITGLEEDEEEFEVEDDPLRSGPRGTLKAHILPLYAALPTIQQMKVFQPPPEGSRLIVLATNVAETSLTIPGVRYVFDCGRSKEKKYDQATGVQTFEVNWISKASASQRMGRAGRTGPGHVYRLYSSAVYEQFFAEHTVPEILRSPIEGTILQLKAMEIENVVNFPFPTPPDRLQLAKAEKLLQNLGAIGPDGRITDIGRQLVQYPLSPRFGQMLRLGGNNKLLSHTVAVVAALAVGDIFIPESQKPVLEEQSENEDDDSDVVDRIHSQAENKALQDAQKRHQAYTRAQAKLSRNDGRSDVLKLLTATAAYSDSKAPSTFCTDFYVREKAMSEIQQLRAQLAAIVRSQSRLSTAGNSSSNLKLTLPSETERTMLNQIVAAGFLDQVAVRADVIGALGTSARKPKRAIQIAYRTLQPSVATEDLDMSAPPEARALAQSVFVHPTSVISHLSISEMPAYLIYHHLSKVSTAPGEEHKARIRMHPLTAIGPKTLANLAEGTPLLEMGKPIGKIEELPNGKRRCWVGVSMRMPGSSTSGWPLTAWKVLQRKGRKGEWAVEKVLSR
ncbi:P-loop containing nucleoside triphosphate hydrolase protein [Polychaeton citri CBS 116435]|uniref:RNA helicase n=1 Tax=Polychaeton citri CBS 116435 TaxID=1314669 RepID=A0A9P4QA94_9PEZI|nr:P-loop containing nucleoside triphosphate hydrolase protein [Polychaeton citri CBS 116435]